MKLASIRIDSSLPRRVLLPLAAVALAGGIGACGDDDDEDTGREAATVAVEVSEPSKGKVELKAPDKVDAGLVRIELTNAGKASHEAQLIRVDGEHSVDEVLKVIGSENPKIPDWLHGAGGVGPTKGGISAASTQILEEGSYYIVDTQEPEGEDTESYAEQGAEAELEVEGDAGEAELPSAPATIKAVEYGFETSGLKAGRNTVAFENAGKELHHAIAVPLRRGATIADARKAFEQEAQGKEPKGPPPLEFEKVTGTTVLDGGGKQVTELELTSGKNVLLCFITDRAGGPPHVAKGMISEVTVP